MPKKDAAKQLSILILHKERSGGRYLETALRALGYFMARVFVSPREAMNQFIRKRFDLMIISSPLAEGDTFELIRRIRAGETPAPRDQVIVLLDLHDDAQRRRFGIGALGINAFLKSPPSANTLDRAVIEAISHHHLALDAIVAMDRAPAADDRPNAPTGQHAHGGKVFRLPAAALTRGMRLESDITIHGHVLIAAGTPLGDAHLDVIESLLSVLESEEFSVRIGG